MSICKMTTGSKLMFYYNEAHSLILFDISVCTISELKMNKIVLYDEEGNQVDILYHYKKETKKLVKNWCVSHDLFYEIFEAKNIELNPKGGLRENLSVYEKLKSLAGKIVPSNLHSPRNDSKLDEVKPLTPRNVLLPTNSRNLTPRSSSSSSTPRSNSSIPRSNSSTPCSGRNTPIPESK